MPPYIPRKRQHIPTDIERPSATNVKGLRDAQDLERQLGGGQDPNGAVTAKRNLRSTNAEENRLVSSCRSRTGKYTDEDASSTSSLTDFSDEVDVSAAPANQTAPSIRDFCNEQEDSQDESDIDWQETLHVSTVTDGVPKGDESLISNSFHDLEITLDSSSKKSLWADNEVAAKVGKKGPSRIERQIRNATHCVHTQMLMYHNAIRNAWICDDMVQKNLVEKLTATVREEVQRWKSASGIMSEGDQLPSVKAVKTKGSKRQKVEIETNPSRDWSITAERLEPGVPDLSHGDPIIRLLKYLAYYWKRRFKIVAPGLKRQGYIPMHILEGVLKDYKADKDDAESFGEKIKDISEFRQAAADCRGSRDVGAQLFTALLRGLGIEARLVASLQPCEFGWSATEDAYTIVDGLAPDDDSRENKTSLAKQKSAKSSASRRNVAKQQKSPAAAGARSSDIGGDLSDEGVLSDGKNKSTPRKGVDNDLPFPHYWTEAFSPITKTVFAVDPLVLSTVAGAPALFTSFAPRGKAAEKARQVIAYVIAHSADGSAKDVTVRYLKDKAWPGKTRTTRMPAKKVPVHNRRGKVKRYEEYDWFKTVMSGYERPAGKRTEADEIEDANDLQPVQRAVKAKEQGETLQGYKNSADYVLERHLRREEALLPTAQPVRQFTYGKDKQLKTEPVFRRKEVVVCKSVETWHKEGRAVRAGEQALKLVPMRAVTLNRKREIAETEIDTGEKAKQGLYALHQTEWIIPPPIVDGKIPRNVFGNIDVYVPTMVPKGAVHLRLKGCAKICRRLQIDYAEACTGFEFGKQRAVPVLTGVVVAKGHEGALRDAWKAEQETKQQREKEKKEKLILATWKRFEAGVKVLARMKVDHIPDEEAHLPDPNNPFTSSKSRANVLEETHATEDDILIDAADATAADNYDGIDDGDNGDDHHDINTRLDNTEAEPDMDAGGFLREDADDGQTNGHVLPKSAHDRATKDRSRNRRESRNSPKSTSLSSVSSNSISSSCSIIPNKKKRKPDFHPLRERENELHMEDPTDAEPEVKMKVEKKRATAAAKKSTTQQSRYFKEAGTTAGRMTAEDETKINLESSVAEVVGRETLFESDQHHQGRTGTGRAAARKSRMAIQSHHFNLSSPLSEPE